MRNPHRPFHFYSDVAFYFITSRTVQKQNFFSTFEKKCLIVRKLAEISQALPISIYAYTILNNHLHLLMGVGQRDSLAAVTPKHLQNDSLAAVTPKFNLASFINKLHSVTALRLNQIDKTPGRKVWYQYWDYCIRNEIDFWKHFNYIHNNPLKHGLVQNLPQAFEYQFSSGPQWISKKGIDWLFECLNNFPIVDFSPSSKE